MNPSNKKAFTLIELLVVSTIIAILIAVGAVSYSSINKRSRDSKRKSDIEQIRAALEMYRADKGSYIMPDMGEWQASQVLIGLVDGDFIPKIPIDSKSQLDYYYRCTVSNPPLCYGYELQALLESTPVPANNGSTCTPNLPDYNYCVKKP
jgi:prepilin-type N-terminal cleavage/methylation domain-containing protein